MSNHRQEWECITCQFRRASVNLDTIRCPRCRGVRWLTVPATTFGALDPGIRSITEQIEQQALGTTHPAEQK